MKAAFSPAFYFPMEAPSSDEGSLKKLLIKPSNELQRKNMILFINDIKTIADLQDKFNLCYQSLKIEFYRTIYKEDELPFKETQISSDHQIGEVRKKHNDGFLELKSWFTISKVEQEFQDHFGLNIQIFYLKDDIWVEALPGSNLTLEGLNRMGETKGAVRVSLPR